MMLGRQFEGCVGPRGTSEPEPSHGAGREIRKMEKALVTTMRSLQGTTANKAQLSSYDKVAPVSHLIQHCAKNEIQLCEQAGRGIP